MKRVLAVFGVVVGFASIVGAQSLGDIAKKTEEERDKSTASSSTASKAYSDKDLKDARSPFSNTPAEKQAAPNKTRESAAVKADGTTSDKGKSAKDEVYWRARWTPIQRRLDQELAKSTTLKARVSELTNELNDVVLNARRRGLEAERQRLTTESDTLDSVISADKAALGDIQEEGRRAGALPGWFR